MTLHKVRRGHDRAYGAPRGPGAHAGRNSKPLEGWHWPWEGDRYHYFIGNRSLCKKWELVYNVYDVHQNDGASGNCEVCIPLARERRVVLNEMRARMNRLAAAHKRKEGWHMKDGARHNP